MEQHSDVKRKIQVYTATSDKVFMGVVLVILWFALIVVLLPMIYIVASSFSSAEAISTGKVLLWPVGFNVRGYALIFSTSSILRGYRNSIEYTVVATAVNIVMTLLAAYPLSRKDFQARSFVMILFSITMFFNGGLIPTYLLVRSLGILNSFAAMVLPVAMGVWNVIITRTYIQSNIPHDLYECASIEGCGDFRYLVKIVMPLAVPIIAVMALLYAIGHWNSYFNALIYLRDSDKFPLQLVLRDILVLNLGLGGTKDVKRAEEMQKLSMLLRYSTIIVASLPMMVAYPFVQKYFIKGIMIGALKG